MKKNENTLSNSSPHHFDKLKVDPFSLRKEGGKVAFTPLFCEERGKG